MDNPLTQATSGTRHRKQTIHITQHRLCVVMISTYGQCSLVCYYVLLYVSMLSVDHCINKDIRNKDMHDKY